MWSFFATSYWFTKNMSIVIKPAFRYQQCPVNLKEIPRCLPNIVIQADARNEGVSIS